MDSQRSAPHLTSGLLRLLELLLQRINLWLQLSQLAALSSREASMHVCCQLSLQTQNPQSAQQSTRMAHFPADVLGV